MDKNAKVPSHYLDIAHTTALAIVFLVRFAFPDMSAESAAIFAAVMLGSMITFYMFAPREEMPPE